MNNGLPKNCEPGQNHGWKPGHSKTSRKMAWAGAIGMLILAAASFITVCAALLSGCCSLCNTGSLSGAKHQWKDHVADPGKMIQRIAAAEQVYWPITKKGL